MDKYLEQALRVKVGESITSRFNFLIPYQLLEGKKYEVLKRIMVHSSGGKVSLVDFIVEDDRGFERRIPYDRFFNANHARTDTLLQDVSDT